MLSLGTQSVTTYQQDLLYVTSLIIKKYFSAIALVEQYRMYFSKLIRTTHDVDKSEKFDFTEKLIGSLLQKMQQNEMAS